MAPLRMFHAIFVKVLHPANFVNISKKDGKDQESIQLSTIPDPEYHMLSLNETADLSKFIAGL